MRENGACHASLHRSGLELHKNGRWACVQIRPCWGAGGKGERRAGSDSSLLWLSVQESSAWVWEVADATRKGLRGLTIRHVKTSEARMGGRQKLARPCISAAAGTPRGSSLARNQKVSSRRGSV